MHKIFWSATTRIYIVSPQKVGFLERDHLRNLLPPTLPGLEHPGLATFEATFKLLLVLLLLLVLTYVTHVTQLSVYLATVCLILAVKVVFLLLHI